MATYAQETYQNGTLQTRIVWDDVAQTVTTFNGAGQQTGQRAFTAADTAFVAAEVSSGNQLTIAARAQAALAANTIFLALASPTNAQILAQVQLLTKECNALIRLALSVFDSTSGT